MLLCSNGVFITLLSAAEKCPTSHLLLTFPSYLYSLRIGWVVQTVFTVLGSSPGIVNLGLSLKETGLGACPCGRPGVMSPIRYFCCIKDLWEDCNYLFQLCHLISHSYPFYYSPFRLYLESASLGFLFAPAGYLKITATDAPVNWWKPFGSIPRTLTRS